MKHFDHHDGIKTCCTSVSALGPRPSRLYTALLGQEPQVDEA